MGCGCGGTNVDLVRQVTGGVGCGCAWAGNTAFLRCGAARPERRACIYDDGGGDAFVDGGGILLEGEMGWGY